MPTKPPALPDELITELVLSARTLLIIPSVGLPTSEAVVFEPDTVIYDNLRFFKVAPVV
jgi:hypothetical protein